VAGHSKEQSLMIDYADMQAYNALTQRAQAASQAAYNTAMANSQGEQNALNAAKFAWQQKMDEASQTGMWNGQFTMPSQQNFATTFGQWYGPGGSPNVGDYTQAMQQQRFQQAYDLSGQYGQYYAPGTAPDQGAITQSAQNQQIANAIAQAGVTGTYYNPAPNQAQYIAARTGQLAQMGWSQEQAAQTAAAEWGQGMAQSGTVAGGMPAGMGYGGQQTQAAQQQAWNQAMQAAQFQATQQQNQQQNAMNYLTLLSNLRGPADWAKYQQVLGSTPNGIRDLTAAAMGQYTPGGGATTGVQPQAADLNTMQQQVAGNNQTWGSGIGIGGNQNTDAQNQQATGNGTNTYNLPAPNQISAQSWNNFTPTQREMLKGMYQSAGWDSSDVEALYNQSLPKYAQNGATAGTWRLQ